MKIRFKISNIVIVIAGVLIALLSQFWNVKNFNEGSEIVLRQKSSELNRKSSLNLNLIRSAYDGLKNNNEITRNNPIIQQLQKNNIDISIFAGQQPLFWTTNSFNVRPQFYSQSRIEKHLGDYLVIKPYEYKYREFIFTYKLIKNPQFTFFANQVSSIEKRNKFTLEQNPLEGSITTDIVGLPLFYLSIDKYYSPMSWSILFLLGVILLCIGIYRTFKNHNNQHLGVLCIAFLLFIIEYLFYKNHILWNLKSSQLFAPETFASNWFAPNLGVLLFNSVLFFTLLLYINYYLNTIKISDSFKKKKWPWIVSVFVYGIYAGILYNYIGKLVNDSSLSFDFYEIFLFNIYTFISLIIIFFGFLSFYSLLALIKVFKPVKFKRSKYVTIGILVVIYLTIWWFASAYIAFLATLTASVFYLLDNVDIKYDLRLISRTLIPCIFISILFHHFSLEKDMAHRDTIAAKLLLQNEKEPMVKLVKTEVSLAKDLGVIDYYTCDDISKTEFESRIRQVYFNTFADNFETKIFDFDRRGNPYQTENSFTFEEIDTLFNSKTCKPVSNHFTLVTTKKLKGSYLGKFEAYTDSAFYGTYFVLMKPILNNSPGKLSQIFDKSPLDALFTQNQYSYAIYSANRLSRRFGSFKYNTELNNTEQYYTANDYTHYVYKDDLNNKIVVSKPKRNWIQNISSFTLLVLCSVIVFIIYYLLLLGRKRISNSNENKQSMRFMAFLKNRYRIPFWSKLYLSHKLQLYVVGVVFITFCVILIVTVRYFNNSNKTRQVKYLWDKSTQIANTLSTQTNLQAVFERNENNILYDLSKYYNSDINLFDPSGKLAFSSNDKIYEQDLIGRLMKPEVYKKLRLDKKSGVINNEKLGSLSYIASYLSIFDNDLKLKGYINLPYFTNEQDLIREISNYSATLINLFALVFALAAILAYIIGQQIIKPLNTIRKELRSVKLGNQYTPLKYKNNDEIGLLITEYNKMLAELEESTNKLAESERQGAWREMAKQVAHEIKNPLTPMKLTLQHLQLSIQRDEEGLAEKVERTSQLLIGQIESLSKMAEEFSSFATMPEAKNSLVDVGEELSKVCDLFNLENNVTIVKSIPKNPLIADLDPQQIGRVFNNIIKNAIQAMPDNESGKVHAKINNANGIINISIKDNGKGIPAELQGKIFSPNFSTKNSGMGLGLAMSKKIIEQFNGSIRFDSKENEGTTFFIQLPLHKK